MSLATSVEQQTLQAALTAPANPVTANGQLDFAPLGVRGNQIYCPGWYDVDLAVHKQFKTSKETKVEIQAQAIKAFNHVQLNNPAVSSYVKPVESLTAGFGTITGDHFGAAGRVWQFVGKFLFYKLQRKLLSRWESLTIFTGTVPLVPVEMLYDASVADGRRNCSRV